MKVYEFPRLGRLGRLGNQLWQVGATIAYAVKGGEDVLARAHIPADWEYRPYLSIPDEYFTGPRIEDRRIDVANLRGGPWFQELKYIQPALPKLKAFYEPSAWALPRLGSLYGNILEDIDTGKHFTSIHVRRGDYLQHPDRFPQLSTRYWHYAIKDVFAREDVGRAGGTTFLVFSDDIEWCLQNQKFLGLDRHEAVFIQGHVRPVPVAARFGEPADIYDLWLMSRCQAHIISNSSFSWWAAFLSRDPSPIYPDRWFGDPALFATMWNCIPETWRQVKC